MLPHTTTDPLSGIRVFSTSEAQLAGPLPCEGTMPIDEAMTVSHDCGVLTRTLVIASRNGHVTRVVGFRRGSTEP